MKTKTPPRNRELLKRDTMPCSVATDMLCAPGIRQTARERKNYQAARDKVFISTLQRKPVEERITARMKRSTWLQLDKWLNRVKRKREDHQREYLRLPSRKLPQPIFDKLEAALNLRVGQLDLLRDSIEQELFNRQQRINAIKEARPLDAGRPGDRAGDRTRRQLALVA